MKLSITKGTTSQKVQVFIQDSSSTTGAGLTGLAYNTASLTWYYRREDAGNAGGTAVTLATATKGTWTSGGFVEVDSTNMPGWYEIGIPNAVLATGATWATMHLKGATNMAPLPIEIQLNSFDLQTSTVVLTDGSLTAAKIGDDAITAAKIAAGAIDAGTFAAGAIDNNAIATDAISSAEISAAAVTKIQSGLSVLDAAAVRTAIGLASANLDTQLAAIAGYIDTEIASIISSIGALNNLSTTQVKAQVVAALNTDTYAEPSSVPAATATLVAKIGFLMALARNKITQTGSTQTLYADDGSTTVATAAVSDDGTTATRGEFA